MDFLIKFFIISLVNGIFTVYMIWQMSSTSFIASYFSFLDYCIFIGTFFLFEPLLYISLKILNNETGFFVLYHFCLFIYLFCIF